MLFDLLDEYHLTYYHPSTTQENDLNKNTDTTCCSRLVCNVIGTLEESENQ